MTTVHSDLHQLARDYGKAWNAHALDDIMAMHTQDTAFRLHLLGAPQVTGHEAVRGAFAGLLTAWPDIDFATESLHYGDGFFAHRYLLTATLAAPLAFGGVTVEPTGEPVRFSGIDLITTNANLVHQKETYLDIADAMTQLGAL
ncbi:ester cyclase [Amycolatopsis jiangsuensis]|uniref:SnoaL-like domain-containing protein n=1 Tax=Amycolatopsis jiangsuensis TaxID=1181879 RepID=A0A840IWQ2_9PSEU|nr:nuclear transport factor 2 family protein [Amycolatopsis jiangsuensis]MBB4685747.1 hypothetical protein [Amycolatopsis jiangsuensis]